MGPAPRPTRTRGCVAKRRVAAPRSPRRLLRRRCTYAPLCEVPCDCGQVLLLALPIARDPRHMELSQSKGENKGYSNDRRLVRLATNTSPGRPALTPHLTSEIAREIGILDKISETIHPRCRSRVTEDLLNPDSPIASLPHGILHNVPRVCDQPRGQQGRGAVWRSGAPQRRVARAAFRGGDAHTRCYEKCHDG
jgi:hypothetical protein